MGRIQITALILTFFLPVLARDLSELESKAKSILAERCLPCHNPQDKTSGLVLVSLESAIKGGSRGIPAFVPGHPDQSLMMQRILAEEMPADGPLLEDEREIIRDWIAAGAPWTGPIDIAEPAKSVAIPRWWSLQPLQRAEPPKTEGILEEWSLSAIDRFIYAKLREKGLKPSPAADRRTFIRRATFDLLGLPPTPEEVEAFVQDKSPEAYEKLVDRLLASPHYGERWGRHWLDVARFGESHGYEKNHLRDNAWPYRDYVIRSFNEGKPFNQMIIEQLAGDQIAPDHPQIEAATGFLVAGIHDRVTIQNIEGELQKRANDLDDMITATAAGFLGLTVNCARCHDHKFDPIKQTDYYRMQAAFAGIEHGERVLASAHEKKQHRILEEPLLRKLESVKLWLEALKIQAKAQVEEQREKISKQYRPAIDSRGTAEEFSPTQARLLRMSILETFRNSPPALDELEVWTAGPSPVNVALAANSAKVSASSTRSTGSDMSFYKAEYLNDGKFDNVWISGEQGKGQVTVEFPAVETIRRVVWSRDRLGANQGRHLSRVPTKYVLEVSLDGERWEKGADSEGRLPYSEAEREELFLLAVFSPEEREEWNKFKQLKVELEKKLAAVPKLPTAYIGSFKQPGESTYLARRGNPMDKGEVIAPGSLSTLEGILPGYQLDPDVPEGERRLAFARWIADDRNALTARVLVNRVWHYHFGHGFIGTPSDFGVNGGTPTHPELLDWLAGRLVELGWRLKPLHKKIMLSATYRQSSQNNSQLAKIDSEALYLWRFPVRRLDAETVRDSILAVSGKLDRRMGGSGFQLYKYTVDNVATYYPLKKFGQETYRRAVYHQSARSIRVDLLAQYDCPDSALPMPKRVVTTSPLQALSLLNNSFIIDQAQFFAKRLVDEVGEADQKRQVERAYRLTLGRPPKTQELEAAVKLINNHGLFIFCRALFNTNEFVYVM